MVHGNGDLQLNATAGLWWKERIQEFFLARE